MVKRKKFFLYQLTVIKLRFFSGFNVELMYLPLLAPSTFRKEKMSYLNLKMNQICHMIFFKTTNHTNTHVSNLMNLLKRITLFFLQRRRSETKVLISVAVNTNN